MLNLNHKKHNIIASTFLFLAFNFFSSAAPAQEFSTLIDNNGNEREIVEFSSGWKVEMTSNALSGEPMKCTVISKWNEPVSLEVTTGDKGIELVIWDSNFERLFKENEWFYVDISAGSYKFLGNFMYRGFNSAEQWDVRDDKEEEFLEILQSRGRLEIVYVGLGSRDITLIGNEDAMSYFNNCRELLASS